MIEKVVGFDVRDLIPDWVFPYQPERRHLFFLRDDIQQPYSVDEAVWPHLHHLAADLPAWFVPQRQSWDSLSAMDHYVNAHGGYTASTMRIAISLILAIELEGWNWGEQLALEVALSDVKVKLLGYDVAAQSFLSGLSNIGYSESDLAQLKPIWSPYLNEHHLFMDVDRAMAFKAISNNRVKEHAPFFVFGLYALDSHAE
jgi:hypothetical protein